VAGVSALCATTAAVQTRTLGPLAIAYFECWGVLPSEREARRIAEQAKSELDLDALRSRHKATTGRRGRA
jgi:hypothetical protein